MEGNRDPISSEPALEVAYANWPMLEPFMTPEMEAILTTEVE